MLRKFFCLLLVQLQMFAAICNLPAGTYTLSTSAGNWDCGHVPTSSDDAILATTGVNLTIDSVWTPKSFTVLGTSYPSATLIGSSAGSVLVAFGQNLICNYCSVASMGDATNYSLGCAPVTGVTCKLTNSTVNASGLVDFSRSSATDGNAIVQVNNNVFTNSLNSASSLAVWGHTSSPKTSGTRELMANVFDKHAPSNAFSLDGFTDRGNYYGRGLQLGYTDTAGTHSNNFLHMDSTFDGGVANGWGGTSSTDIIIFFDVSAASNTHDYSPYVPMTLSGFVFDHSDSDTGDSADLVFSAANGSPYTYSNFLMVPNAAGLSPGILVSKAGARNSVDILHNSTWYGSTTGEAMARYSESSSNLANSLQVMNNLAWGTSGNFAKVKDQAAFSSGTVVNDVCAPATCDYNWGFGTTATNGSCVGCTNQGNAYWGKFTTTPGANDKSGDPAFADYQRVVALWDSKYLGHNSEAAWSMGGSYSTGNIVQNTVSGTYWSLPVNYRRVAANPDGTACSGNPQPGVLGGTWRNCWEYESLARIRTAVAAGTTITDGAILCSACPYILAVKRWMTRGYTPINPLVANSGSSGTYMGAVQPDLPMLITPSAF